MIEPEFSRIIDLRHATDAPVLLEPDADERRRLAGRFGISAIDSKHAKVTLLLEGAKVVASGRLVAAIVQPCAISGEDFPVAIDEPVNLRFVLPTQEHTPDEEVEITADACDEIEYDGQTLDLGEAIAQTLALAIDPFAEGPEADRARAEHNLAGDGSSGAFAALAALKKKD